MTTQFATTGSAQGLGDGSSEANRIELKKAIEDDAGLAVALAAGDEIVCKNDGELTYDGSGSEFAVPAISGTNALPITVAGYTTTPGDGGSIVIRDTNAGATNNHINFGSIDFWAFKNMSILDCRIAFNMLTSSGHYFDNIKVRNNQGIAFLRGTALAPGCTYVRCFVFDGVSAYEDNGLGSRWVNCVAINGSGVGFANSPSANPGSFTNCLAAFMSNDGYVLSRGTTLINCTSHRNQDGFTFIFSGGPNVMINCAATSNSGFGINALLASTIHTVNCALAASNELNTSGESSANATLLKSGEVTSDPIYVDGNPATKTDVNLTVGNTWREAGIGLHIDVITKSFIDLGVAQQVNRDTLIIKRTKRIM